MSYIVLSQQNVQLGTVESPTPQALQQFYDQIRTDYTGKLKNEWLRILTPEGEETNKVKLRGFVHDEGDHHGAIHLPVYSFIDGVPCILMQKRAANKSLAPNKIGTFAAGHYQAHETASDGLRESEEEVGLILTPNDVLYLGRRRYVSGVMEQEAGQINNEFQDVSLARCDKPLNEYTLQKGELEGIVRIPIADFVTLMKTEVPVLNGIESFMFEGTHPKETEISIEKNDVWPTIDNYYLKVALLARMVALGEHLPENPFNININDFPS